MDNKKNILNSLHNFKKTNRKIKTILRHKPSKSDLFFKKFNSIPFKIIGYVGINNTTSDIFKLLENKLPKKIKDSLFFKIWLNDMSNVSEMFCNFLKKDKISFWLGSERGCRRFHVDNVPFRLLVTYSGKGTEILPDKAADRNAFVNGKTNKEIVKDKSLIKYQNQWDISIFRGGKDGLLHRTPDSALNECSSVMMKLDDSSFLEKIYNINGRV